MPDYYQNVTTRLPVKENFVHKYTHIVNEKPVILTGDLVTINHNACLGCGKCKEICPLKVIELIDHKAVPVNELDCTLCRLCEINCHERAISLHYSWIDAIKVAIRHGKRKSL